MSDWQAGSLDGIEHLGSDDNEQSNVFTEQPRSSSEHRERFESWKRIIQNEHHQGCRDGTSPDNPNKGD
jgi:hypothetical protein